MRDETPLLELKNIGPTIAARCKAVGLKTVADLRTVGLGEAYRRLQAAHPRLATPVCYYLYSLQGALDGVHWDALSSVKKEKLLKDAGLTPWRGRSRRRARERG